MSHPSRLPIDDETSVLVLTGAGVSAESGIPTFRDAGGLWEHYSIEEVASPEGFARDPALVWRFYSERRRKALTCAPNPGHHALAELETRLGDRFLLATQNVDGLHRRAGNVRLVEIHGNLFRTRCSRCSLPAYFDETEHGEPPTCAACARQGRKSFLRPDIVWFGEMLDPGHLEQVGRFMADARRLVFLAAGTSGAVWPAAGFVNAAHGHGGSTWLVNAEASENAAQFDHFIQGRSGEVLPGLLGVA